MKFRFGNIAAVFYEIRGEKPPKQLDLIDTWFPGLIIAADPSDGGTKKPAEYADREYMIRAVRYHGSLYAGGSPRVTQIAGRLELVQKHVAECFVKDMTLTPRLKENVLRQIESLSGDQELKLFERLLELVWELADEREAAGDYEKKTEAFAMDDETFDGTIYNAAYQLNLAKRSGLCNAYLWLLTGSLLRNETGRVLRLYDSSFIAIRRQLSETGSLRCLRGASE